MLARSLTPGLRFSGESASMSLHFQPAAARLLASFADPALIGANDVRTWLVRSRGHCARAAWKKAGYGALKARALSLLRPRDNASFARLSVCGLRNAACAKARRKAEGESARTRNG